MCDRIADRVRVGKRIGGVTVAVVLVWLGMGLRPDAALAGSCCEAGSIFGGGGCDEAACENCVCAASPTCCVILWTSDCASTAQAKCYDQCACATCGDGACTGPENPCNCPSDCTTPVCGDGCCGDTEDCVTCPTDCGACTGDCCAVHDTQGCDELSCQNCVCGIDSYCCTAQWDMICANRSEQECYAECSCSTCGDGLCSGDEDPCSCSDDCGPSCGDGTCDACENCASCPDDCGACTGDCCAEQTGVGCDELSCQDCVCAIDPYCCTAQWDGTCAGEAQANCYDQCACAYCGDGLCVGPETTCSCPVDCGETCGDGCCTGNENCVTCPTDCGGCTGDCCTSNGSLGCDELSCQSCVCSADPFCCDTAWDELCAERALGPCYDACGCATCGDGACTDGEDVCSCPDDCGPSCGNGTCDDCEDCVSCPDDCGACAGDCCTGHATIGCDDQACQDCVCADDAFCCDTQWDGLCVDAARDTCYLACACSVCGDGLCTGPENPCECPADCGPTTCGDSCCGVDENCANCPTDCGSCTGDCCAIHGTVGCEELACQQCVCALDNFCCDVMWDSECRGEVLGNCYGACSCATCGDGVCSGGEDACSCPSDCGPACGNGVCDAACEDCLSCPGDCGACPGDCCTVHGNGGCDEPGCVDCICSIDPFCCFDSWDDLCVDEARNQCYDACGCSYCGDGTCTGPEDSCTCSTDCGPTTCGDGCCGGDETCVTCDADCGACAGSCCDPNGTVGCEELACQQCVCAVDSWCCDTEWDGICAQEVYEVCGGSCTCSACGDGVCAVDETCATCAADCGACGCATPPGDITGDGAANVVDAQCDILATLWVLGGATGPAPTCLRTDKDPMVAADFNCDGQVDITDIQALVTLAVGASLSTAIDANGDGCPDACQGL